MTMKKKMTKNAGAKAPAFLLPVLVKILSLALYNAL